jgi:hypothetical protein
LVQETRCGSADPLRGLGEAGKALSFVKRPRHMVFGPCALFMLYIEE